jgi:hypothetical protein
MPPRAKARRQAHRIEAVRLLEEIITDASDTFVSYGRLCKLFDSNDAVLRELRPFFEMSGITPTGTFSMTDAIREKIRSAAAEILPRFKSELECKLEQQRKSSGRRRWLFVMLYNGRFTRGAEFPRRRLYR